MSFTEVADVDYAHDRDVVALSVYTFLAPAGYAVARTFRERGKLVIIGGPHAKGCLDEVKEHADLVFDRCDESVWCETLRAIEAGAIAPRPGPGRFVPSPDGLLILRAHVAVLAGAAFEPTRRRTAVASDGVAVVAVLVGIEDAVPAHLQGSAAEPGSSARAGETPAPQGGRQRRCGSHSPGGSKGQFEVSEPPSISNTLPVTQLDAGEAR